MHSKLKVSAIAVSLLVSVGLVLTACGSSSGSATRVSSQSHENNTLVDGPWIVVRSGQSGNRSWSLHRRVGDGNECFKLEAEPQLPGPQSEYCDVKASPSGDRGGSPLALNVVNAGDGAGFVIGGVAPDVPELMMHLRDGSNTVVTPRRGSLVVYSRTVADIVKFSFSGDDYDGKCVAGTPAADFNCSWSTGEGSTADSVPRVPPDLFPCDGERLDCSPEEVIATVTELYLLGGATPAEAACLAPITGAGKHAVNQAFDVPKPGETERAIDCVGSEARLREIATTLAEFFYAEADRIATAIAEGR